jgi:hypothetical protein
LLDGHHELRPEEATRSHKLLHAPDEVGERPLMVDAVVPGTARPDCVASTQGRISSEEILFDDSNLALQIIDLEPGKKTCGMGEDVTG